MNQPCVFCCQNIVSVLYHQWLGQTFSFIYGLYSAFQLLDSVIGDEQTSFFLWFTDYIVFRLLDSVIGDEQTSFFLWFTDYIVFRLLDSVIGGYWRRKLTYFTFYRGDFVSQFIIVFSITCHMIISFADT
mgnify:CR=1 FL=1